MPYQVLGANSGAVAVMTAWTRSARARSASGISAIVSSTACSSSTFVMPPRPAAFNSRARSLIAARSSSVKPPGRLSTRH